jgi:hypothetical protein
VRVVAVVAGVIEDQARVPRCTLHLKVIWEGNIDLNKRENKTIWYMGGGAGWL